MDNERINKPKRWQFSLWQVMLVMTLACLWLGVLRLIADERSQPEFFIDVEFAAYFPVPVIGIWVGLKRGAASGVVAAVIVHCLIAISGAIILSLWMP